MRRALVVSGIALVAVLAVPAVRRSLAGHAEAAGAALRRRVADFRTDVATREAELRSALLPDPADVEAAQRRRSAPDDDVDPY